MKSKRKKPQSSTLKTIPNDKPEVLSIKAVRGKTKEQQAYIQAIKENDIVICTGPAGCGKTYLAVSLAIQMIAERGSNIHKIAITRPIVESGNNPIGFLPGSIDSKTHPYMIPIYDSLLDYIDNTQITLMKEMNQLEVAHLGYMRGRTFKNTFMILDEAQNTDYEQLKMFMTRMGPGSKMLITGDLSQVDIFDSGLKDVIEKLRDIDGIKMIEMTSSSIQRHPLVATIVEKLK